MDPLEKRTQALQEALQQVEQPDRLAIWKGILRIPPVKNSVHSLWPWKWIALAAALLLLGACMGYWWRHTHPQEIEKAAFADLPLEWQAKIHRYEALVGQKEDEVRVNQPKGGMAAEELLELQLLDSLQQTFLKDFQALPKDYRTAERYLHYYEQKIRILELVIKEIQIHKHEKERNAQQQI